ncbi:uncharacterized protein LTR77_005289 [Saxophila tyrrhenica]|uniref:FAD dependent oxidoreductase domain-containing protein n=1 Tax=Saxophila tyrrhenica TaxID=1690608 RepID=A0AAV9PBE8_9PEZI|nr:hypothetical protein LTR77_005289 [Saxophila tyrrhenica]
MAENAASQSRRAPASLPTEQSTESFWHSEPSSLLKGHRTTRDLPTTADVVVIGSGMTGASVAYHMLSKDFTPKQHECFDPEKDNLDVVMLEAREACWGATGRNGGHCLPLLFEHPHDLSIGHFELDNLRAIRHVIQHKNIDCEFKLQQQGIRAIYDSQHLENVEASLAHLKHHAPDIASHVHLGTSKSELASHHIPSALGAVITDPAAKFWPYKYVAAILTDLLNHPNLFGKFNLQTLTPATSITPPSIDSSRDMWRVSTRRGNIQTKKVVLATNGYISNLLPSFSDLVVPVRGQMSALKPLPSVAGNAILNSSYGFLGAGIDDYLIQRVDRTNPSRGAHLMFGGGRQHDYLSVGATDDSVIDEDTARYLRTRLLDAFDLPEKSGSRTVQFKATHEWTGIMGFSRDELPWVGAVPSRPGLYISAGYTGHGMPNAWLCGKHIGLLVNRDMQHPHLSGQLPRGINSMDSEWSWYDPETNEPKMDVERELALVGLPEAYVVTEERIRKAMGMLEVEAADRADRERGREAAGGTGENASL